MPKRGARLREIAQPGQRGKLCHVRGFVDGQPVLRCWSSTKRRWVYSIDDAFGLRYSIKIGRYKVLENATPERRSGEGGAA